MGRKSRDVDLQSLENETAAQYAHRLREHFASKAEHNKRESLSGSVLVILGTVGVPATLAIVQEATCAKTIAVILSLLAGAASTWLHFRRPNQLWGIYRSAQRYIESHQVKHRYGIDDYAELNDKDRLLAKNVAAIALAAHELWVPLIPSPEGLDKLRAPSTSSLVPPPSGSRSSADSGEE